MEDEIVAHTHTGILVSCMKDETVKFVGKWRELGNPLLKGGNPDARQAFMFSYLWILTPNLGVEETKLHTLGKEKRTKAGEEMELWGGAQPDTVAVKKERGSAGFI